MTKLRNLGAWQILRVRLVQYIVLAAHCQAELAAPYTSYGTDFFDQSHHIRPLKIVRSRVPKERFEGSQVPTV